MDEMIEILNRIAHGIGGEWKELVLLDEDDDNPLVYTYNEGVKAMAKAACRLVQGMLDVKVLQKEEDKLISAFRSLPDEARNKLLERADELKTLYIKKGRKQE